MVAQDIVIPLHKFTGGEYNDDPCTYTIGEKMCGELKRASVHAVVGGVNVPKRMQGHSWRNLNPPEYNLTRCTFAEGDDVCGKGKPAKIHAGYAPQENLGEDEEDEPVHPDVLVHEFFKVGTSEAIVDEFLRRVLLKVREKDAMYGEAWRRRGWNGNLTRILTKADRLENMLMRDVPLQDEEETVMDTVEDMAALCAFFAVNFNDKNRYGGQR